MFRGHRSKVTQNEIYSVYIIELLTDKQNLKDR